MKKLLLSTAALAVLTAGSAVAADLPSKKAPVYVPPPPVMTWTGFYGGVSAGAVVPAGGLNINASPLSANNGGFAPSASIEAALAAAAVSGNAPVNGVNFLGGGQIGFNYQVSPLFVAGLEADIAGLAG